MSRWFRFYDEALDDPKVQRLAPALFKSWVNLMCLNSKNGGTLPPIEDIAFALRVTEKAAQQLIEDLGAAGLIDEFDGRYTMHNWHARQFKSDVTDPTAAERMKRYRNKDRNGTVTVTPPRDRVQITDTEKKESFRPKRVRTLYPEDFENEFWKVYPRTPIMSKVQALREFEKLSEEDRKAAIAAVPRFVAWLKTQKDHPAVHACRFLSQRRFDGFAAGTTPVNTEPIWKKPPAEYLESQEQANGSKVGTQARGGPGVDQNGCDRPEKLRVPGGAALRPEVGGEGGGAPHDPKMDA